MKPLNKPRGSLMGQGCFLAFALLWTGFSVFMFVMAWREKEVPGMAFISLFLVIGLVMIVAALWRFFSKLRLSAPMLMISHTELCVGERFNLDYQQTFKGASDVTKASISLVFQEAATYTQGTDTRTDRHDIVVETHEIPGRRFESGEVLQQSFSMMVPADAMHTFIAKNNELQWLIRVHVDIVDWPDMKEDYPIRVLPQKTWDI
jgi:hypothetical protein